MADFLGDQALVDEIAVEFGMEEGFDTIELPPLIRDLDARVQRWSEALATRGHTVSGHGGIRGPDLT